MVKPVVSVSAYQQDDWQEVRRFDSYAQAHEDNDVDEVELRSLRTGGEGSLGRRKEPTNGNRRTTNAGAR